jgi:hypothetical protein
MFNQAHQHTHPCPRHAAHPGDLSEAIDLAGDDEVVDVLGQGDLTQPTLLSIQT